MKPAIPAEETLGPPRGPRAPEQAAAARPNARRRACLVVVDAPDAGAGLGLRFALGDVTRIGAALDNDITLGIDEVAPHHARVVWRATAYHLIVEAAPTWLGDRLVQNEAALRHGDQLRLGRAVLELLEGHSQDALDEAYHESIYRLTITDGTTGARNGRMFDEALSVEMRRSRRRDQALALAIFHVDGLARIGAEHGPRVRDDALRAIARRLMALQRPHDLTARLGADELAVMMPETSAAAAREWVDAARAAIREAGAVEITVSAGIAVRAEADQKPAILVARARSASRASGAR